MGAGCLLVPLGGLLGLVVGWFGTLAAMALGGGGRSHNDIFVVMEGAVLGALLGGAVGPKVILAVRREWEHRRTDRLNAVPYRLPVVELLCAAGAAACVLGAATFL